MRWRRVVSATLVAAVAAATGLVAAGPAAAGVYAVPAATLQPFAAWGDSELYYPFAGGDFDSSSQWSSYLASFTGPDNPLYKIPGAGNTGSMSLASGGVAIPYQETVVFSPSSSPAGMRMFIDPPDDAGASLTVNMFAFSNQPDQVNQPLGQTSYTITSSGPGWQPSPSMTLPTTTDPDGTVLLMINITASSGGTWLVDDLVVDPRRFV